jgi:hypothetical protein
VIGDRPGSLQLQAAVPAVVHQHRIERRRVERAGNAPAHDDRSGRRIGGQAHVVGQRHAHQHGGIGEHPAHALPGTVVGSVSPEQRIVRIACEPILCVVRRHGPRATAMTGQARSSVATERFALEQVAAAQHARLIAILVMRRQLHTPRGREHQYPKRAAHRRACYPRSSS